MQKKSFRKICALLISVALMCGIIPMSVMADVAMPEISYVNENGSTKHTTDYTFLTGKETEFTEGTYVARGYIHYNQRMTIKGDVTIILDEFVNSFSDDTEIYGASTLAATGGFYVPSTSSLKVYSSIFNNCSITPSFGAWNPIPNQCAGIGGNQGEVNGPITIVGVSGTVYGGYGAPAIGTGGCGNEAAVSESDPYLSASGAGSIILCRSGFTCIGGYSAASIGGGFHADSPDIYMIDCNTIGAYPSGLDAAAIGGGAGGQCGVISISGGSVTAIAPPGNNEAEAKGAAIGNGYGCPNPDYSKCRISIRGAQITAVSVLGSSLICSASDDSSKISDSSISIDPGVSIQVHEEDNGIVGQHFTKDVRECLDQPYVSMNVCKHTNSTFECTSQQHLRSCPECRTEFVWENHSYESGKNVCKECGYGADAILRSATVIFEGKLSLRYTFSFSKRLLDDEGAYVSFVSKNTGVELLKVYIKDGTTVGEGSLPVYPYNTQILYPFNITDAAIVTVMNVYDGQGNKVSLHSGNDVDYTNSGFEYSPARYAGNVYNFTYKTIEMKNLAHAFSLYSMTAHDVIYGYEYSQYAQLTVGEGIGDSDLDPYAPVFEGTRPEDISRITLRMYFEDVHTLRVTFYFKEGVNPGDYEFKLDGQKVRAIKTTTGGYAIEVGNISAVNLSYVYNFTIAKKGGEEYTIKASGLSYGYTSIKTGDDYYMALGKGMYYYNKNAIAYFEKRDGASQ